MKILKNKYFILGNIALLLAVIPLTLFFISRQQDVRSKASPTTTLTFTPATVSLNGDSCNDAKTTIKLNPGENLVATVELFLTYDATKFDIELTPNTVAFKEVLRAFNKSNGQASIIMTIGSSVTDAVDSPVDIATITIIPVEGTGSDSANITIDSSKTRVFSLSSDADTENVFLSGGQAAVSIDESCLDGGGDPEPSPTVSVSPTPTGGVGGGGDPTPTVQATVAPTSTTNQSPICSTLVSSPASTGTAPFVITLTAQGSDNDGSITKATFNFGDSTIQDVVEGLGTKDVTTELSHTYQTAGTYSASVIFTDNSGAVSSSCTKDITVNAQGSVTDPTPTTGGGIAPTATPTPTPTIESPGGIETTAIIIGGLLLIVLGGLALIVL